ncbi:MAG: helix-hairpin-helix domain-containing protein [Polyangia bacterium]
MDAAQSGISFTVEPKSVGPGGSVTVSWANAPQTTSYAWVGMYASAETADTGYITYKYVTAGSSGSVTFTMPENAATTYEFRFFPTGGYDKRAKSESVAVNPPPPVKLTAEPRSVGPEGAVTVSWKDALKASSGGWIGLYSSASAADNGYVTFKYLGSGGAVGSEGSLTFNMPEEPGTSYEFRMFPFGGYDKKATSTAVTVEPPPPVKLTVEPQVVHGGDNVTVSWSAARKATTSGWIGLYAKSDAADNGYLTYKNITATEAGSLTFTMPKDLGATYEFRIFPRGGYDKKATSGHVAVKAAPTAEMLEASHEIEALKKKVAGLEEELAEKNRRLHDLAEQVQKCHDCEVKLAEQSHAFEAMEQELKKNHGAEEQLAKQQQRIAELEQEAKKCGDCEAKLEELHKTIAVLEHKLDEVQPKAKKAKPDDLKVVEGIGPKIAELLGGAGITTFKELAEADVARIKQVLSAGGPRFSVADPSSWPAQAKLAGAGQWDELHALQAKLKAGRGD